MNIKHILPAAVLAFASGCEVLMIPVMAPGVVVWYASDRLTDAVDAAINKERRARREIRRYEYPTHMSLKTMFPDAQVRAVAEAAGRGQVEKVEALAAQGADVNARGKAGATPLFWALRKNNVRGFEKLLELGADPDVDIDRVGSVMHYAISSRRDVEFLRLALRHGGDPDLRNFFSSHSSNRILVTPLFKAIPVDPQDNTKSYIRLLLEAGANIDAGVVIRSRLDVHSGPFSFLQEGITPVAYAANEYRYDIVLELLSLGADHTLKDGWGYDLVDRIIYANGLPLNEEEEEARQEVIAWLSERGEKIPELEDMFSDPWIRKLFEPVFSHSQALELTKFAGPEATGTDVNVRGENGVSPLLWALMKDDFAAFRKLLELGADPNIVIDHDNPLTPSIVLRRGLSVMHWVAGYKATQKDPDSFNIYLESALSYGGNPNLEAGPFGETPLFETIGPVRGNSLDRGRAANRGFLLGAGADIDARSHGEVRGASGGGRTVLMVAADIGRYDIVLELLYRGADHALQDDSGAGLVGRVVSRVWNPAPPGDDDEKDFQKVVAWLSEHGVEIPGAAVTHLSDTENAAHGRGRLKALNWSGRNQKRQPERFKEHPARMAGVSRTANTIRKSAAA